MGLILDLAVMAIAAVVVGSLALLTWTLGVSTVHAVADGRAQVAGARAAIAVAEARVREAGQRARALKGDDSRGTEADPDGDDTDR